MPLEHPTGAPISIGPELHHGDKHRRQLDDWVKRLFLEDRRLDAALGMAQEVCALITAPGHHLHRREIGANPQPNRQLMVSGPVLRGSPHPGGDRAAWLIADIEPDLDTPDERYRVNRIGKARNRKWNALMGSEPTEYWPYLAPAWGYSPPTQGLAWQREGLTADLGPWAWVRARPDRQALEYAYTAVTAVSRTGAATLPTELRRSLDQLPDRRWTLIGVGMNSDHQPLANYLEKLSEHPRLR